MKFNKWTLGLAAIGAVSLASAARADEEKLESITRDWGYYLGNRLYAAYLDGKAKPRGLRRLLLAHLDRPGAARKVCTALIARLRAIAWQ